MSSSIAETVSSALNQAGLAQYQSHARPVVDALNAREANLAEQLIDFATQQGMDEADAAAALRQAGMFMRETAMAGSPVTQTVMSESPVGTIGSADAQNQQANAPDDGELGAVLARINATLEDLAGFARQNGWRPTR